MQLTSTDRFSGDALILLVVPDAVMFPGIVLLIKVGRRRSVRLDVRPMSSFDMGYVDAALCLQKAITPAGRPATPALASEMTVVRLRQFSQNCLDNTHDLLGLPCIKRIGMGRGKPA